MPVKSVYLLQIAKAFVLVTTGIGDDSLLEVEKVVFPDFAAYFAAGQATEFG
jgi:hypothetical protein